MPLVSDTAYPCLEANPSATEVARFTPTPAEIAFVRRQARRPGPRLALLILLKTFQRLGHFVPFERIPLAIVEHVAETASRVITPAAVLADYQASTYRSRLTGLVREYLGVAAFGSRARGVAEEAAAEAARLRDGVADIINAVIEELVRRRFELPAFGTLVKIAMAARATANRDYYRRVAGALPAETRRRLNDLLILPLGQARTAWDRVKTEPKRPTPRHMRDFLLHLDWLRDQGDGTAVFTSLPAAKVRSFATEARALTANVLAEMVETKRLTLMAALVQSQIARTFDDLADMFIRQVQRTHARAKEALAAQQLQQYEHAEALVALLRDTVLACRAEEPPEQRLAAVEALLLPDAETILERCAAHAATTEHGHIPFLVRFARGQRRMFLRFLATVPLVTTSQDRSLEQAIPFVLAHRDQPQPTLRIAGVDLSFVPASWWPLVFGCKARDPAPSTIDRRFFELCLFTQVMIDLKSGDLCIPGSETYGDYRDQLVSWNTYQRDIAAYTEQAGLPASPTAIIAVLRERLSTTAEAADAGLPANEHVEIVNGKPVLKRLRARPEATGAAELERRLKERL
ncbi:MAG: DUF4158 domain-containing protein, partial [Alphaproteobacteria bacterium]|nr:DUF4158 domain-containing protein [Alphaproteobacteria bacterium]